MTFRPHPSPVATGRPELSADQPGSAAALTRFMGGSARSNNPWFATFDRMLAAVFDLIFPRRGRRASKACNDCFNPQLRPGLRPPDPDRRSCQSMRCHHRRIWCNRGCRTVPDQGASYSLRDLLAIPPWWRHRKWTGYHSAADFKHVSPFFTHLTTAGRACTFIMAYLERQSDAR